jgi:SagB-type dehydrogenase family enzyme
MEQHLTISLNMNEQTQTVINYHHRTKHQLERYAKGPETLDWDDQPDPYRRFAGCESVSLPEPGTELPVLFTELDNPQAIEPQPLTLKTLGLLLELSFGLSAWKQYGPDRWALRCNPSSGNLHPTEAYLINTDSSLIRPGVYHYVSHDHHLERRALFTADLDNAGILIGLSSLHWREAWKYGERAYRYCQHDIGHALGALRYAAAALGWSVELLAGYADDDIAALLGLNRLEDFKPNERESPDVICRIRTTADAGSFGIDTLSEIQQSAAWSGRARSLNAYHMYKWPVIDEVAAAAAKPRTEEPRWLAEPQPVVNSSCRQTATAIIRQRRSAQHFDGKTTLLRADFFRLLSAVLPGRKPPFDLWCWPAKVHLFIFVHHVEGLAPGLYALPRAPDAIEPLQAATLADFDWQPVTDILPLYHLYMGDCRQIAKSLSCHQAIASNSAFSLAMVAEFNLDDQPWIYRRLFWECGLIGQALYLEAEAAGVRGTGIGCYFDDSVHEIFGIKDERFQSLYHFTVGTPLEDTRIQTLPAYAHLQK